MRHLQGDGMEGHAACGRRSLEEMMLDIERKSLLDQLADEAVSECERAIAQARRHFETGERTPEGAGWETCFRGIFRRVLEEHGIT